MRGIGIGAVSLGVVVIAGVVVAAAAPSGTAGTIIWVAVGMLAAVALIVLGTGIARVSGLRSRLVMDDDGFLNATGPGAGVRRAQWRDVRRVKADGDVVSVDLSGNRQSVIHTSQIAVSSRELARELRTRLNRDRGYTPLNMAAHEVAGNADDAGAGGSEGRSEPESAGD